MRKVFLVILVILGYTTSYGQTTLTKSYNMERHVTATTPQANQMKSFQVRFEIINDTLTLIDSFVTNQFPVDSFLHTNMQADTVRVEYNFYPNYFGDHPSCDMGSGAMDSIFTYKFKLFHKDSFAHKVVFYKQQQYVLLKIGPNQWDYTPKAYDLGDSVASMKSFYNPNQSGLCPKNIFIRNDSILIQVPIYPGFGELYQFLKEEKYSTTDSFKLLYLLPCGNPMPSAFNVGCYEIYLGDTLDYTNLDVQITTNSADWFHYERTANGIITYFSSPLPANGLKLEVKKGVSSNKLFWSTTSEKNTSHYNIMKGNNGIDFEVIGTLAAKGNSDTPTEYFFDDNNKNEQLSTYYRIDLVDLDQQKTHSNVVFLAAKEKEELLIFPNPVNHQLIISNLHTQDYKLQMVTTDGHVLIDELLTTQKKKYRIDLSAYPKGMYLINLQNLETGINTTRKIVKEQ